jgi:molybdopterin-synthase adenylyltransferase
MSTETVHPDAEHDGRLAQRRYAKQILVASIGVEGQALIRNASAVVVGLGALGTVIADNLCRAGVGRLRLVDRDYVEWSNLQRQTLFDEEDAERRLPKAVAAAEKLRRINREVELEPLIADVHADNVLDLLDVGSTAVVLDGTDNLETRFLLNDACVKTGTPWVYGGALGTTGSTMPVIPGQTPCFRCLIADLPPPGTMLNCDTEGVLAALTGVIGSLESAAALSIIVGGTELDVRPLSRLLTIDVGERDLQSIEVERRPDCPTCGRGQFDFLSGERTSWTTVLCGRDAVQIMPPGEHGDQIAIDLERLRQRLSVAGETLYNGFLLSFRVDEHGDQIELVLFPDGRAIIKGTTNEAQARGLYARYVGA